MNNSIEFIPMRDMELYDAYKKAFRRADVKSHRQAIQAAINTKTSRYWISTFQAYREILKIKKGKAAGCTRSVRRRMIQTIYSTYQELENKPAFRGCSTFFITSFAVQREAPEFYISYSRALAIISRINRKRKNEE